MHFAPDREGRGVDALEDAQAERGVLLDQVLETIGGQRGIVQRGQQPQVRCLSRRDHAAGSHLGPAKVVALKQTAAGVSRPLEDIAGLDLLGYQRDAARGEPSREPGNRLARECQRVHLDVRDVRKGPRPRILE